MSGPTTVTTTTAQYFTEKWGAAAIFRLFFLVNSAYLVECAYQQTAKPHPHSFYDRDDFHNMKSPLKVSNNHIKPYAQRANNIVVAPSLSELEQITHTFIKSITNEHSCSD